MTKTVLNFTQLEHFLFYFSILASTLHHYKLTFQVPPNISRTASWVSIRSPCPPFSTSYSFDRSAPPRRSHRNQGCLRTSLGFGRLSDTASRGWLVRSGHQTTLFCLLFVKKNRWQLSFIPSTPSTWSLTLEGLFEITFTYNHPWV